MGQQEEKEKEDDENEKKRKEKENVNKTKLNRLKELNEKCDDEKNDNHIENGLKITTVETDISSKELSIENDDENKRTKEKILGFMELATVNDLKKNKKNTHTKKERMIIKYDKLLILNG